METAFCLFQKKTVKLRKKVIDGSVSKYIVYGHDWLGAISINNHHQHHQHYIKTTCVFLGKNLGLYYLRTYTSDSKEREFESGIFSPITVTNGNFFSVRVKIIERREASIELLRNWFLHEATFLLYFCFVSLECISF
jgi:hypothetical protein